TRRWLERLTGQNGIEAWYVTVNLVYQDLTSILGSLLLPYGFILVERKSAIGPIRHFDWDGPYRRLVSVQWTIRLVRVREPHRRGRNGRVRIIGVQFGRIFHRQEEHHVA